MQNKKHHSLKYPFFRAVLALILIGLLNPFNQVSAARDRQEDIAYRHAQELMGRLTTAEKVGQLFLVAMDGTDIGAESQVYQLINSYGIGGVMLLRENNNFVDGENALQSAHDLISGLQQIELDQSQVINKDGKFPSYIPLFIGTPQEGDGAPNSQLLTGMTNLPNEMTMGATWDPDLTERNGEILGSELQNLGINLLIGPSLDVLELPVVEGGEDLGTRTFGGDPYWVGVMGKAFIRGIHTGSENKVAVMSKHFPGRGGSDRPSEAEVATVRKSLEQLKQIELAPFLSVTSSSDPIAITDGLLVSHIRYQGFQGNIRVTTRPVSIDSTALSQMLTLPEFATWRDRGGIILSDDLGSNAIRRFNDPTLKSFDARQTARNALLAGNDLLYVKNFTATGDPDSFTSIIKTLDFFIQKYDEDPAFAQRVDLSVLRILALKFKLYPTFNAATVLPEAGDLTGKDSFNQVVMDTAQEAASLINPPLNDLSTVLPDPPGYQDRIVFLMDSTEFQQCATCAIQEDLPQNALAEAVLRLYGPNASGQVSQSRLSAFNFTQLNDYLTEKIEGEDLVTELQGASWVVVGLQKLDKNRPASSAFRQLLATRPDFLRNKKVVVFAFNAPYYLDATDITSVTAYYALYSKSQPFIDLAARILFQEVSPHSAAPISIAGVGYDLITATAPDPDQIIPLRLDTEASQEKTPASNITAGVALPPVYSLGDNLPLITGMILDGNQNPVPDGTLVKFIIRTETDTSTTQQLETTTIDGVAKAVYRISTNGFIEIKVVSEPALTSEILQLDIPKGANAGVTAVAPTPLPSATPVPSETPAVTPTSTGEESVEKIVTLTFWEWVLVMMIIGLIAYMIYLLGRRVHSIRWGIRWALCALIGGATSFVYLAIGLPGGEAWLTLTGTNGMLMVVILFTCLGFAVGVLWHAVHGRPGN